MTVAGARPHRATAAALLLAAGLAAGPVLEHLGADIEGRAAVAARLATAERWAAELPRLRAAARAPAATGLAGATDSLAQADLQARLRRMAEQAGLVVTSAEPQAVAPGAVAVAVGLSGSLAAIQRCLHAIETGSPAMAVDRLSMEPAGGPPAPEPALRIALTVRALRSSGP